MSIIDLHLLTKYRFESFVLATLILCFAVPGQLAAQSNEGSLTVAETIPVAEEEVAYGDVILYDGETGLYRIAQGEDDPRVFGVVVEDPALLLETDPELVPVLRNGRMPVNVSLENGDIESGDPLVTSSRPGMAMLASEEHNNIFGFAAESLSAEEGVVETTDSGEEVAVGTILVDVQGDRLREFQERQEAVATETEENSFGAGRAVRFSVAAIVALGSIFVTFYTFLASIRSGVSSVGRNPRAKSAIRSMVILNIVLALIITIAGIFFAISLLVVPD